MNQSDAQQAVSAYRSLLDLPMLAGLCDMQRAVAAEWSVEESVNRLKVLHYLLKRLSEIWVFRITSEPIYELKTLFSHHAYLAAEHTELIRRRVAEMREPPLGLEHVPHPALGQLTDELQGCPERLEFCRAVYELVLARILEACKSLQQDAHPLADAPTVRVAKWLAFELSEMLDQGKQVVSALAAHEPAHEDDFEQSSSDEWLASLETCLQAAITRKDTTGEADSASQPSGEPSLPPRLYSTSKSEFNSLPARDERFQDPYNAGVNPEAFLYDEAFSARDKSLMMYYKRLRELDVPETMASILTELKDQEPWAFYYEMVRQLWDEARHAMMGEVGFVSLGIDWTLIPINFTWSLNLNTQLTARERHGVLFFIEQGLMPKTGKRFEWEVAMQSGDPLCGLFQDFDWADEVLHAQIGRRWYVPKFASLVEALNYGDRCWSKVMSHWSWYRQQGFTQHRNWWPELYQQACAKWGVTPDPRALAFCTTYEESRADLQNIREAPDIQP